MRVQVVERMKVVRSSRSLDASRSLLAREHFTRRIGELRHEESDVLLGHLKHSVANPLVSVRYRCSKGMTEMWDSHCIHHFVINDFEQKLNIQCTAVMGDQPEAAFSLHWQPLSRFKNAGAVSRHDRQRNHYPRRRQRNLASNLEAENE